MIINGLITVGNFVTPPQNLIVSRRQGRLALLSVGLLDQVENLIENIADPVERKSVQIEYEASTWDSENETLKGMWHSLGGTDEELVNLFNLARTL